MSFMIEDDSVLVKHNEIWIKIKKTLNIKFHSMPIYDEKYIKSKIEEFNGAVNTNFWSDAVQKQGMHCTFIACVSTDSVMKIGKSNYPRVYLECKYKINKKKMSKSTDAELELDSDLDSE